MIQRIQTLWLFLASMLNGLLFLFPLFRYNLPNAGANPWIYESVRTNFLLMILAAIITLLPLITILLFADRKRQRGMIWITIISIITFIVTVLMRVSNLKNATPPATNLEYLIPGLLVAIGAIVFLVLALQGIRKDDKLIKSLDRLR